MTGQRRPRVDLNEVFAFFSLAGHMIRNDDLGGVVTMGGHCPRQIPVVLLARLALDKRLPPAAA